MFRLNMLGGNSILLSLLAVFIATSMPLHAADETSQPNSLASCVINAKDNTFAALAVKQPIPVFIFFTDGQSQLCKTTDAFVEEFAREYARKMRVVRVVTTECPRVTRANRIMHVPSFCFVNYPARATFNYEGYLDKENLRGFIEQGLNPTSIIQNANVKYAAHNYDGAIRDYTQALQLSPNDPELYNARGNARYAKHDYRKAIADYTQAIKLNPDKAEFYDNRALSKNASDDLDGAVEDFTRAIEMLPTDAELWSGRGFVKNKLRDFNGAIADYTEAIKLKPKLGDAYHGRGLAKQFKEDWDGATADFQEVVKQGNNIGVLDLWVVRKRQGQGALANRELTAFLAQFTPSSFTDDCVRQIGDFLVEKINEKELAARMANVEIGWKSNVIACNVYYYQGQAKLAMGDKATAVRLFQQAVATGETSLIPYAGALAEQTKAYATASTPPVVSPEDKIKIDSPTERPVDKQAEASAFFQLGEMVEASGWRSYFVALGDKGDRSFQEMMARAKTLDAPEAVIADIQRTNKIIMWLPFSVPFEEWKAPDKKLAANALPNNEVWNDWLHELDEDKYVYYWLGRYSFLAWFGIQKDVVLSHVPISKEAKNMKTLVEGVKALLTEKRYKSAVQKLSPETFAVLKQIDSLEMVVINSIPTAPSMVEVKILGEAGKKLREINKQHKLLKD